MKIKYQILIGILLFTALSVSAQKTYSIKGNILDSASQIPVNFITISLKTAAGLPVKTVLTKEDGSFLFEKLATGKYKITTLSIAYDSKIISVDLIDSVKQIIDLGNIFISTQSKQLMEVIVKADRPIVSQEIDRLVYDVQADPESKQENLLEVMRKVPLLSFDGDNNIQLKGSSDFKIFINGRPSGMMAKNPTMALRAMRSSNIKKIEVITTPPAKYDSEGTAGIINIITGSILEGYNIIFEAMNNTRMGRGVGSAFTVKTGKFGANGYLGRYFLEDPIYSFNNYRAESNPSQAMFEQSGTNKIFAKQWPFNTELSYEIDSLNLLTSSIGLSLDNRDQYSDQLFNKFGQSSNLEKSYSLDSETETQSNGIDIGLNYQLGFKKIKERLLTTSYRYLISDNGYINNTTELQNFNYMDNELDQQNKSGLREHTVQLDYVSPIKKKLTVEGGVKLILRNNYSNFSTDRSDTLNGTVSAIDDFGYTQDVYSFYNSYQFKLKNGGIKAGLRLERTVISADFITSKISLASDYNNLVPSVVFQHKLKNKNNLSLGYTQRIQRPAISQLNPFVNQSNPLYFTLGNPDLLPVLSHNVDVNYTRLKKGTSNVNLNYSFAKNTIQNIVTMGADGITRSSFANIGRNDVLGINLSVNYPINKDVSANINGRVQYLWTEGTINGEIYENEGLSGNTNASVSYKLKDWRLSGRLILNTRKVILQGQSNGYIFTALNINKEFFNKKLGMILTFDNPFQEYISQKNKFNTLDFTQETNTRKYLGDCT